jgi:SAM-dependent methyltransferase
MTASEVIWHDIECGSYREDLPLWRRLAREHGDPILEVGAGTGRVALDLARLGHDVTALDCDQALLEELAARASGLPPATVVADARSFSLGRRFALCLVPMQAIQLLGDAGQRAGFLRCARAHLLAGGVLAIALTDAVETFDMATAAGALEPPVPDMCELDGVLYASRPIAVRAHRDVFVIERLREITAADGAREVHENRIALHRVSAAALEHEGHAAGLRPLGRVPIAATDDYVGSEVVMLGA